MMKIGKVNALVLMAKYSEIIQDLVMDHGEDSSVL